MTTDINNDESDDDDDEDNDNDDDNPFAHLRLPSSQPQQQQ